MTGNGQRSHRLGCWGNKLPIGNARLRPHCSPAALQTRSRHLPNSAGRSPPGSALGKRSCHQWTRCPAAADALPASAAAGGSLALHMIAVDAAVAGAVEPALAAAESTPAGTVYAAAVAAAVAAAAAAAARMQAAKQALHTVQRCCWTAFDLRVGRQRCLPQQHIIEAMSRMYHT
jgi:hypothetical protein